MPCRAIDWNQTLLKYEKNYSAVVQIFQRGAADFQSQANITHPLSFEHFSFIYFCLFYAGQCISPAK